MYLHISFKRRKVCHKSYRIYKSTQIGPALSHLHEAGWVHRDFTPGNVIVVGKTARISDFEFAIRRAAGELEELTRPRAASLSVMRDIRVVGLSSANLTNRTDPDQGTLAFVAIEVEEGQYSFFPDRQPADSGSKKGSDQRAELSEDGKATDEPVDPIKRVFLHNPLHDYESVWWIAIWFVFSCEPEGVDKHVMERARDKVYKSRYATLVGNALRFACDLLPAVLKPLGEVLAKIRNILVEAYKSFEGSFDGSEMLLVFKQLERLLLVLKERASGLAAKPPIQTRMLNAEGMKQFDAVALEEEQGQRMAEHEGGRGGHPTVADDPPHEDAVWGKRTRADLPSEVDRVLRPKTNQQ